MIPNEFKASRNFEWIIPEIDKRLFTIPIVTRYLIRKYDVVYILVFITNDKYEQHRERENGNRDRNGMQPFTSPAGLPSWTAAPAQDHRGNATLPTYCL